MSEPITTSLVTLEELGEADIQRWRELASAAVEPNPFFEPDFVLAVAGAVEARHPGLLVASSGDRWVVCIPVHQPRRWHRVPIRGLASWRTPYTYLGAPLVREDSGYEQPWSALLDRALARRGVTLLGLDLLAADGPAAAALSRHHPQGSRTAVFKRFERAVLRRHDDAGYVAFQPKHRREIQRLGRRLAESLDAEVEVVDRAQEAAAVEDFLALESSGWKGREGTAMAQLAGHGDFLRSVCRAFAASGRLQLLCLQAGGEKVAMKCNLRAGSQLFCFKIAFDDRFAHYSPGMQLELANINAFEADPEIELMDSCAEPTNEMINRLWADRRELVTLAIGAPGPTGLAAAAAIRVGAHTRGIGGGSAS